MMSKSSGLLFAAALLTAAVSGQAFASEQSKNEKTINDKNAVSAEARIMLAAQQCFSSGSGWTLVKVCITDNGNVSYFESPAGFIHLNGREGYALCTDTGNGRWQVNGFDVNYASNGWSLSTVSQPNGGGTFPLIITRLTLDGLYQLKQTFTSNWSERGIDVKIELTNL